MQDNTKKIEKRDLSVLLNSLMKYGYYFCLNKVRSFSFKFERMVRRFN